MVIFFIVSISEINIFRWMIKEKEIALGTALELVRLPPFVPQSTR
jgi:hypothetical protein